MQALGRCKSVQVVGIADRDPGVSERVAKAAGTQAFTDDRSLLAEARPEIVYLGIPTKAAGELISTCAARGIHVLTDAPLARNLEEGVSLAEAMDTAGLKLAVATHRRFANCYRRAWQLRRSVGQAFLARTHYLFNWGPYLGWRGDKESAGGGALLELGYHLIDLLVWLLGLPEDVYGLSATGSRPADDGEQPQPVYDTDDTAVAVLRFKTGCMATVVTTRRSGPVSEELCLYGPGGSLTVNGDRCALRDPDGKLVNQTENSLVPLDVFVQQAKAIVRAVRGGTRTYRCSAWENLLNLAVIDAIYLSDRTGHPESPARLLKTHGLRPADCLRYRPRRSGGQT